MAGRQGWNLKRGGPSRVEIRGPLNHNWKGEAAKSEAAHLRARKLYERLGACQGEGCSDPATDRHHVSGNAHDNSPENIRFLCRRCHMIEDGRLDAFKALPPPPQQPPKNCVNCGYLETRRIIRHGRCVNCAAYWDRHKTERPEKFWNQAHAPTFGRKLGPRKKPPTGTTSA